MHLVLLLLWIAIAIALRFTNLATKPLWADEFSTLIFSLGNSYRTVPLSQVLSFDQLLQPLQPNPQATLHSVIRNLFTESNHPPIYFVLTHLWLKLFPLENGYVSVLAARSLSAWLGVATVPAMFGLGWLTGRSLLVGQLAAALMAVSPFNVYLAQEARHYTLAVGWIIASLSCLVAIAKRLQTGQKIPLWLCLLWIGVNGLGVATHYFVILALVAEAITLVVWLRWHRLLPSPGSTGHHWTEPGGRLLLVGGGTLATILVWVPVLSTLRGTELTRWLQAGEFDQSNWIDQLVRSLAALISMLYLLPMQGVSLWILIISGSLMGLLVAWTGPVLWRGWINPEQTPETRSMVILVGSFVAAEIALSWFITFGMGTTFGSVFRYRFVCLPGVILLVAIALANGWHRPHSLLPGVKSLQMPGRLTVSLVLLFALLGGVTVTTNWGYQRTHRPDQVAATIHATFGSPTLIAIPHKTHGHTGRLMGIAWELQRLSPTQAQQSSFLLAHYPDRPIAPAIAALQTALHQLPRPLHVWRVNFRSEANPQSDAVLKKSGCFPMSQIQSVDGYRHQRYACD